MGEKQRQDFLSQAVRHLLKERGNNKKMIMIMTMMKSQSFVRKLLNEYVVHHIFDIFHYLR